MAKVVIRALKQPSKTDQVATAERLIQRLRTHCSRLLKRLDCAPMGQHELFDQVAKLEAMVRLHVAELVNAESVRCGPGFPQLWGAEEWGDDTAVKK